MSHNILFAIYYHQTIDFKSKIYKTFRLNPKTKIPKMYAAYILKIKVELINIGHFLQGPGVVQSLPTSSVRFPTL